MSDVREYYSKLVHMNGCFDEKQLGNYWGLFLEFIYDDGLDADFELIKCPHGYELLVICTDDCKTSVCFPIYETSEGLPQLK